MENVVSVINLRWETHFKDSEIGKIPEDWDVKPIGELAQFTRGFSYRGSEKFLEPNGYVFVTLNNLVEGGGFML
jgi:type I restriction enzyme S subunit